MRGGVYIREGVLTGTAGKDGLAVAHGFGTSQYAVIELTGTGRLALVLARTPVGASHHGQTHSSCPPAAKRLIPQERRDLIVENEVVPDIGAVGPGGRQARDR